MQRIVAMILSRGPAATAMGRKGLAALACGLLVLVAVAISSAWQAERNAAALQRLDATQALRLLVTDVLVNAQNAETGQRGYLLTENPTYLTPFRQAKAQLPRQLDQLQAAFADGRTATLRDAVGAKLAELQQTVDLVDAGQPGEALALVQTNAGHTEMERIRDAIAGIAQDLDAQVRSESDGIRSGGQLLIAIDVAALALVIGLVALVALGVRSYLDSLRVAQRAASDAYAELERNAAQLDETVRFRTADLTVANQEMQRFAYIVSHDLRAPLVNIMGFTGELEHATARWSATST